MQVLQRHGYIVHRYHARKARTKQKHQSKMGYAVESTPFITLTWIRDAYTSPCNEKRSLHV